MPQKQSVAQAECRGFPGLPTIDNPVCSWYDAFSLTLSTPSHTEETPRTPSTPLHIRSTSSSVGEEGYEALG